MTFRGHHAAQSLVVDFLLHLWKDCHGFLSSHNLVVMETLSTADQQKHCIQITHPGSVYSLCCGLVSEK